MVWNMDLLANTKIKLTRKDVAKPNSLKSGYHTKASSISIESKLGKFLQYNSPRQRYWVSKLYHPFKSTNYKIIRGGFPLLEKRKSFSAMDIETMEFKGKELPISISIRTKNYNKIFTLASVINLFVADGNSQTNSNLLEGLLIKGCSRDVG
jgi:hypothetical protein